MNIIISFLLLLHYHYHYYYHYYYVLIRLFTSKNIYFSTTTSISAKKAFHIKT